MIEPTTGICVTVKSKSFSGYLRKRYKKRGFSIDELTFEVDKDNVRITYIYGDSLPIAYDEYLVDSMESLLNYLLTLLNNLSEDDDLYDGFYYDMKDMIGCIINDATFTEFILEEKGYDSDTEAFSYRCDGSILKKMSVSLPEIDIADLEKLAKEHGQFEEMKLIKTEGKSKIIDYLNALDDNTKTKFSSIITGMAHIKKKPAIDADYGKNIYGIMCGIEIPHWEWWDPNDESRFEFIEWKIDSISKKK